MPVQINGTEYLSVTETAKKVGVSRQTLWRWRSEGSVPQGQLFRGKHPVFSPDDLRAIEEYANRLEPIEPMLANQLGLFNGPTPRGSS